MDADISAATQANLSQDAANDVLSRSVEDPGQHLAGEAAHGDQPVGKIDADLCHAIAVDLQNSGRSAEAETFYRAALALAPERSDTWSNLGLTILHSGRAAEAVECERQALRIDPDDIEALNNL